MKALKSLLAKWAGLISTGCFLVFTVLVLVLHALRPEESPLSHTISEYAVGPDGFLMTIAFLLRALGTACLVVGLAVGTTRSSRSRVGLGLLALFAVYSLLVAIFPTGELHSSSALIGFSSLTIAALAWAQRLRKEVRRRGSALAHFVLGLLLLLSLVGFFMSPPSFIGLTERTFEIIMIVWLCFVAWQLSTFVFLEPPCSSL